MSSPIEALAVNIFGLLGVIMLIITPWLFVNDIKESLNIYRPCLTLCLGLALFIGWVYL